MGSVTRFFSDINPDIFMSSKVNFAKRGECKRCNTAVQEQWRCKLEGGGIGLDRWEAELQQHQD